MLVYATPSYPTYSPLYPVSHFAPAHAPTARERYLRALADAQSARERYVSEQLEEQRILASLGQQEALRQAEFRHQEALRQAELHQRAAQSFIPRRRAGRACVGSCFQPTLGQHVFPLSQIRHDSAAQYQHEQPRTIEDLFATLLGDNFDEEELHRQREQQQRLQEARAEQEKELRRRAAHDFIARRQSEQQARHTAAARRQQEQLRTVEELFEAILGSNDEEDREESRTKEQQKLREARADHERKKALHKARVHFISKLDAIREEVEAARDSRTQQPQVSGVPAAPSHVPAQHIPIPIPTPTATREEIPASRPTVPLTRKPEIPRMRNPRDRAARAIQRQWRSHSADAAARKDALATIAVLRARFQFLKGTFSFPEHLEFRERATEQESGVPALLYTPSNAGVHAYMHELTKLLMNADGVSSGGSRTVREERRTFVRGVEDEIETVEAQVGEIWGKRVAGAILARHGAEDVSHAPESVTALTDTVHASNTVERQPAIPVDVTEEATSDSAPADDVSDVSTSPSTIIPSHAHLDASQLYPRNSDLPSQSAPAHDQITAIAQDTEDDVAPPAPEVPHVEHDVVEERREAEDVETQTSAIDNRAVLDADDSTPEVDTDSTPQQPSESQQEPALTLSQDSAVETLPSISSGSTDATEAADLDAPVLNPTPAPEPFDVVYPSSPSSTYSDPDANGDPLQQAHPNSVSGDDKVPGAGTDEAGAKVLSKQGSDDGFELI